MVSTVATLLSFDLEEKDAYEVSIPQAVSTVAMMEGGVQGDTIFTFQYRKR